MVTSEISDYVEKDECFIVRHGLRGLWHVEGSERLFNRQVVSPSKVKAPPGKNPGGAYLFQGKNAKFNLRHQSRCNKLA